MKHIKFINYAKDAVLPAIAAGDAEHLLGMTIGKRIRIVFTDGSDVWIEVAWVDEEGFGYSGPEPSTYARSFELVNPSPISLLGAVRCGCFNRIQHVAVDKYHK